MSRRKGTRRFPLDQEDEQTLIEEADIPRTRESLARDLRALGLAAGMTVEVHSSLRSLGWVCGGPVAVVQALMDVITEEGTLMMPTQTAHYTDPAKWRHPPVPASWLLSLYDQMPAFDPHTTPSRLMGQIAETFRTWPGVVRSTHPTVSFAAWGKHAQMMTADHPLDYGLGEGSPLARLYDLDGFVLLLDTTQFLAIAGEFESEYSDQNVIKTAFVELALTRLFPQRLAVDAAVKWIEQWNPLRQ